MFDFSLEDVAKAKAQLDAQEKRLAALCQTQYAQLNRIERLEAEVMELRRALKLTKREERLISKEV